MLLGHESTAENDRALALRFELLAIAKVVDNTWSQSGSLSWRHCAHVAGRVLAARPEGVPVGHAMFTGGLGLKGRSTSNHGLSGSLAGRLLPGDVREPSFDLSRELSSVFAEHGEIPQQGVTVLAIGLRFADRVICGKLLCLLHRVDHFSDQEDVTLHRRAGLWLGRMVAAGVQGAE